MDTNVPRTAQGCPYLPPEIHLVISGFLEDYGRWDTLAVLSRSSKRLRSIYEPRLYSTTKHANNPYWYPYEFWRKDPARDSNNLVKALIWGITNESVPVMAQAKAYGADINARVKGWHGKDSYYDYYHGSSRHDLGTMLQHAVQNGRDRSVVWLIKEGAVINTPGQAAVDMCNHAAGRGEPGHKCSTLHLALCKGHLLIAKLIMDYLGPAALEESKMFDWSLILQTAMHMALAKRKIEFLSAMLEYPSVRDLVNVVNPNQGQTVLEEALLRSASRFPCLLRPIIETLVHQGGASLGPYPAGFRHAEQSPLLHVLSLGGYITTQNLLRLGCDPDGKPPIPVDQTRWWTPLHCLIRHEGAHRGETPIWMGGRVGCCRHERRSVDVRELIEALVRSGASLMIKAPDFNSTPLENAISHGAPFLSLSRRVAAYKLLKLLLKQVKEGKTTEAAREEAEQCMERIKEDLRAEHALYDLSDERVIEDNEDDEDDGDDGRA
ncbi:hypothetical protein N0V85_005284 [Neurospora sp. IMI 360204]|nr:hypothetical protein N0V85_005284 [Neurospora sp. IMI 360204]